MSGKHYIYKFIDKYENIIYIGQTNNIGRRINKEHFTNSGHLPTDCYIKTNQVYVATCSNKDEMSIYERYLINKYSPIYNEQLNNESTFRFNLPELEWKKHEFKIRLDKDKKGSKGLSMTDVYNIFGMMSMLQICEFNTLKYIVENDKKINILGSARSVACFDLYSYECMGIFISSTIAGREIGVSGSNIYKASRRRATCGGYVWMFLDDMTTVREHLGKI